ncbi:hypothetical protein [Pseudonocardia sp. NPDC046786]|uniref:hypothetical protein n=1 Tax=Pseudonocardia sp. NPDC046786 TaxID=3155471 RepID=UPI0033D966DB
MMEMGGSDNTIVFNAAEIESIAEKFHEIATPPSAKVGVLVFAPGGEKFQYSPLPGSPNTYVRKDRSHEQDVLKLPMEPATNNVISDSVDICGTISRESVMQLSAILSTLPGAAGRVGIFYRESRDVSFESHEKSSAYGWKPLPAVMIQFSQGKDGEG